jgi:hypothetical protein
MSQTPLTQLCEINPAQPKGRHMRDKKRRYSAGRGVLGVGRVALGHLRYAGGFGGLVTAGVKMSMIDSI